MTSLSSDENSLSNLIATINSVAAGNHLQDDDHIMTHGLLDGTVLHLPNGQSLNVVQMTGSLDDSINVVQVEATELGDVSMDGMCAIDIDVEEQQHILSETGAHVVVNTENEILSHGHHDEDSDYNLHHDGRQDKTSVSLPSVPFSFPGQSFDTKCQKLILNVWDFFRRVKKNPDLLDEIRTPQERAAAALHISAATIGKIGKKFRKTGKLETPGKRRNRVKPVVDSVDLEQEAVIREILKEFKASRTTPTLPLLLNECRDRINYQGGSTSFRRILQRMGLKGLGVCKTNSKPIWKQSVIDTGKQESEDEPVKTRPSNSKKDKDSVSSSPPPPTPKKSASSPSPAKKPKIVESSSSHFMSKIKQEIASSSDSSVETSNLSGDNLVQVQSLSKMETFSISPQTLSRLALSKGDEPAQTIHVLRPDNTIQQIQIIYANEGNE